MRSSKKLSIICISLALCLLLCGCTEKVKLSGGKLPVDSSSITAVVTAEDIPLLDGFTNLSSADFSGSLCYQELYDWAVAHPEVDVKYTVTLPEGSVADNSVTSLDLSALEKDAVEETIKLLGYLPQLETVDLGNETGKLSLEDVAAFAAAHPGIAFDYDTSFMGKSLSVLEKSLDLSDIGHKDAEALLRLLPCMTKLETVDLGDETGSDLLWEDIHAFQTACPHANFSYDFNLYGLSLNLNSKSIDLNHMDIPDEGAHVLEVVRCMPKLEYLDMDSCGVSDEGMAAIRDAAPQAEVVWRIWFGERYSVRTNVERILASNPGMGGELTPENSRSLKYCTKVKYLDLGHNVFMNDITFLNYMPDLEVLIIAMAGWSDIEPLANCPKLEYAELQTSALNDLSPLAELENLRHLNICYCFALHDISPLYNLPQLERIWIGKYTPIPADQIKEMQKIAPNCKINTTTIDPSAEGWRYLGHTDWGTAILDPRYELLRDQFHYGENPYCYSYIWNDPLY